MGSSAFSLARSCWRLPGICWSLLYEMTVLFLLSSNPKTTLPGAFDVFGLRRQPGQDNSLFPHSIALKCLTQSFQLKTGAKQREQATRQSPSAPGYQEDVGFPAELWKMPESHHGK